MTRRYGKRWSFAPHGHSRRRTCATCGDLIGSPRRPGLISSAVRTAPAAYWAAWADALPELHKRSAEGWHECLSWEAVGAGARPLYLTHQPLAQPRATGHVDGSAVHRVFERFSSRTHVAAFPVPFRVRSSRCLVCRPLWPWPSDTEKTWTCLAAWTVSRTGSRSNSNTAATRLKLASES